jgi:putative Mn2+ efflux pump MntP
MTTPSASPTDRTTIQIAAAVFGAVLLLLGLLGLVPGVTSQYDSLELAGHRSRAELLGVFQVSLLHNALHFLLGAVGLAAARSSVAARFYMVYGGTFLIVLAFYGFVVGPSSQGNVLPVNPADDWLHLFVGIAMVALGWALGVAAEVDRE